MDLQRIHANLKAFIKKHSSEFYNLQVRETALLELGALTMTTEHYRLAGFSIEVKNAVGGLFRAKLSSRGHPFNFSWFECQKGERTVEIHSNLAVSGSHRDGAIYVVDVAVVEGVAAVPKTPPKKPWACLENQSLVSFVEVKKLVVYPMLLAQFVGIVHEIKPRSLKKSSMPLGDDFPPTLISLGYLKGTSGKILRGFAKRSYKICVIHNFDIHLSQMRRGVATSTPFVTISGIV